jgi:hypothetical protein
MPRSKHVKRRSRKRRSRSKRYRGSPRPNTSSPLRSPGSGDQAVLPESNNDDSRASPRANTFSPLLSPGSGPRANTSSPLLSPPGSGAYEQALRDSNNDVAASEAPNVERLWEVEENVVWLRDVGGATISWEPMRQDLPYYINTFSTNPVVWADKSMTFQNFKKSMSINFNIDIDLRINRGKIVVPSQAIWIVLIGPVSKNHDIVDKTMLYRDLHDIWRVSDLLTLKRVHSENKFMMKYEVDIDLLLDADILSALWNTPSDPQG